MNATDEHTRSYQVLTTLGMFYVDITADLNSGTFLYEVTAPEQYRQKFTTTTAIAMAQMLRDSFDWDGNEWEWIL